MKTYFSYLYILVLIFCKSTSSYSQINENYDSLCVYYVKYTSTFPTFLSENYLKTMGDSLVFAGGKKISKLQFDLSTMKKKTTVEKLNKIRKQFSLSSIDIRILFEFYYKGKLKQKIGVSYLPLMFINNSVFECDNKKLKSISLFSENLYQNSGLKYYFLL